MLAMNHAASALPLVTPDQSPYERVAYRYLERGYSVIPIAPGTKRPGQYSVADGWRGQYDWERFNQRLPTDNETQLWDKWPGAGIGLLTGKLSGVIGLDRDHDAPGTQELDRLIPYTPVKKKGAKGYTAFFRYNGEKSCSFDVGGARVLDVLSEGRQTLMPGTIHPDGHTYIYLTEDLLEDYDPKDLPVLPDDFLEQVAKVLEPYQTQEDKKHQKKPVVHADPDGRINPDPSISNQYFHDLNQCALAHLDDWVPKIIPGAKSHNDGYRCVATWRNAKNPNVSIHPQGIMDWGGGYGMTATDLVKNVLGVTFQKAAETLRTLVPLQEPEPITMTVGGGTSAPTDKQSEQHPAPPIDWNAKAAEYIEEKRQKDEQALKSITEVEIWKPTTAAVPEHLKSFPVTQLNKYLYWLNRCAEDTVNSISVASVIHLAAAVVARGAQTNMDNHSSLYLLLIAPTGTGKNYGKNAIVRILDAADVSPYVSGEVHSKGGIYSAMRASPTVIFHLDEFGDRVKLGIKDGSPLNGAFSYFKEVYSGCGSVMPAHSYSTVGMNKAAASSIRPVMYPCINLYCLTTPRQLWEAIDNASVEGGFLNRFVGVLADSDGAITNDMPEFVPPAELLSHIREVRRHLAGEGNLGDQKFTNPDIDPGRNEYQFDGESKDLLKGFKQEIKQAYEGDDFMHSMAIRWRENAMRMAVALHVFATPTRRVIDAAVTQWCIDYVRFYGGQFAKAVLEHSRPNGEYGRVRRDFLLAFRQKPGGTSPSDLGRYAPWKHVRAQLRSEIIQDLKEAGLLAEVAKPTRGQRGQQGKLYVALAET